jgi:hypothetical protein
MIKNKKDIFIITILILILLTGFISMYFKYKKEVLLIAPVQKNIVANKINKPIDNVSEIKKDNFSIIPDTKKINVYLNVSDKKYQIEIEEGSSVFIAMKILEEKKDQNNLFNFKYTENKGMGSFITEINGVKGKVGKYWIYYVNDKLASVGVSNFILKQGDIINWKNEGI